MLEQNPALETSGARMRPIHRRTFVIYTTAAICGLPPAIATAKNVPTKHPKRAFRQLETRIGGRIGVFAYSPHSTTFLSYRPDERFALCSTFKWVLAAAILSKVAASELALDTLIPFGPSVHVEHAPFVSARLHEGGASVAALARAAVTVSDNAAANLLLERVGGPAGLTAFMRSIGDEVTRLDRFEPDLNENTSADPRDTTSPQAMARTLGRVLDGDVLPPHLRERLVQWLIEAETGLSRLRAGLPDSFRVGDKTGTGRRGACNDVAVVWPPGGPAWFIAAYLSGSKLPLHELSAAHAEIGRVLAAHLLQP